jgi:hypothetical protein
MVFLATANRLNGGRMRQCICKDRRAEALRTLVPEFAGSCRPRRRAACGDIILIAE